MVQGIKKGSIVKALLSQLFLEQQIIRGKNLLRKSEYRSFAALAELRTKRLIIVEPAFQAGLNASSVTKGL